MKLILIYLTFIMALVQGDIDVGAGVHRHRAKRTETAFSQEEIEGIVNLHNEYRGMVIPEASNMKHMSWDDNLAMMAQIWSDGCVFAHGNPDIMTDFQYVGQNLWAGTIFDNGLGATTNWYNETVDYDYNTGTCAPGKVCGHYTQVVWAESYAVGCGRTFCSSLVNYFPNSYIITCNYGPGGNIVGQDVYLPGPSCTECSTGIGECYNNLCRPCSEHSEPCECRAECHNCGTMNSDCSCTCRDGWRGPNCARECENTDVRCGNGWPTSWCGDSLFPFVDAACHLQCGYCNPADPDFICSPTTTPSTTTPLPQTTPGVTQVPTTTTHTPQATTAAAQSPMSTRMPTTEAPSTPSTVATTTQPPCTLTCLNGGRLDSRQCTCNCLSQYQGSRCQNLKSQVRYGVELTIAADISIFPRIRDLLFAVVSRLVTDVCNGDNFYPLCCPGNTGKDADLTLNYVDSSHVSVADGYPEERPQYDPIEAFAVMLLITPPTPSDLCMENWAFGRKRRDAQSQVIVRNKRQTETSSEGYLGQGALYEAVSANIDTIANEVNVTVLEVTRGAVEEGEVLLELQYVLIIIIAIIVALAIILAIITICWGRKTDSAKKNSGGKRKPHTLSSSQF